jgi:hypothetical protein
MVAPASETHDRAQCCYTTAYRVLPGYAFERPEKLQSHFSRDPDYAAKFFYVIGCTMEDREPDAEEVRAIKGYSGPLNERLKYHLVEFPKFPPVNVSHLPDAELFKAMQGVVLAPYFSAIVYAEAAKVEHYFVLGQSPDGLTTFRTVTPEMNANLGRGCAPDRAAFVALLADRLRPGAGPLEPIAGVRLKSAPPRKKWWQFWR